ncbi:MAG: urea ABC transporter permease subunit UrtB [Acidiferrobacterales bacterium]
MKTVGSKFLRLIQRRWITIPVLVLVSTFHTSLVFAEPEPTSTMQEIQALLAKNTFDDTETAIGKMAELRSATALNVLSHMIKRDIYLRAPDNRPVIAIEKDDGYHAHSIDGKEDFGVVNIDDMEKLRLKNSLRRAIREAMATLRLYSEEPDVRMSALKEMQKNITIENLPELQQVLATESHPGVKAALHTAINLAEIGSPDSATRLNAAEALSRQTSPLVKNRLELLLQKDAEGNFAEPDASVRDAARKSIASIDSRLQLVHLGETVFFGISLGSVLLLSAIGLAITFGVMGVINMAHGELMMIGAYTTYVMQLLLPNDIGVALILAIPAAFIVSGLFGIAIERGIIRFLYGRPLETLLATFGLSLVLQQLVRNIFSPLNRSVSTPDWMSGSMQINDALSLTLNRMYIVVFALVVFAVLMLVMKKTLLGLQVRAVAQNRQMARAMGVRTSWVDALTFGLGSGIAGVAGVALSQLTNVGPNLGQTYIVDSFMIVVFGGVGNLWGTLVGAMSLGVANKFLEPWSGAVLAKILVLIFIILFIQKKPLGLFPQKGRTS